MRRVLLAVYVLLFLVSLGLYLGRGLALAALATLASLPALLVLVLWPWIQRPRSRS